MAVVHGYATLVTDSDTAIAASVGTINLQALAEQELAYMLRAGDYDGFIGRLSQLSGENGEPELQAVRLDLPDSFLLTSEEFPRQLAAVLGTDQLEEAVAAWYSPPTYRDTLTNFAVSLLESTVLAEYSDAAAMAAAGAVGAASMGGSATVVAALVTAGSVGGVALLIAGPIGIVVIGVAATVVTFRLLTRKRR